MVGKLKLETIKEIIIIIILIMLLASSMITVFIWVKILSVFFA